MCLPGSGALADAIIGNAQCVALPSEALDTAFVTALENPPINLRSGAFSKRVHREIAPSAVARIAIWLGVIAVASLLISLIQIARYQLDTRRLDAATLALASPVLPDAKDALGAEQDLKLRLAETGAGAQTFSGGMAVLVNAMRPVPSARLKVVSRGADGMIRASLSASRAQDIGSIIRALEDAGSTVTATSSTDPGGRTIAALMVSP
jgi:general secretion pathway protein L